MFAWLLVGTRGDSECGVCWAWRSAELVTCWPNATPEMESEVSPDPDSTSGPVPLSEVTACSSSVPLIVWLGDRISPHCRVDCKFLNIYLLGADNGALSTKVVKRDHEYCGVCFLSS